MKRKAFLLALATICLMILTQGTLAYYNTQDTAHNIITTSGVDVDVVEYQQTDNGLAPFPGKVTGVMPGTAVSKVVTVKNLQAPAYVRVRYQITLLDENKRPIPLTADEIKAILQVTVDEDTWLQKAGDTLPWWYYPTALGTDEATTPLFEEVIFAGEEMTNAYQNCDVLIDVITQATQAANNGTDALTAAGWPED